MPKFTLNQGEMIEILDPLDQKAYDKLQGALERKICEVLSENKWLEIWEEGDWNIEMSITFNNIEELSNV
jgi:hypothetical protein